MQTQPSKLRTPAVPCMAEENTCCGSTDLSPTSAEVGACSSWTYTKQRFFWTKQGNRHSVRPTPSPGTADQHHGVNVIPTLQVFELSPDAQQSCVGWTEKQSEASGLARKEGGPWEEVEAAGVEEVPLEVRASSAASDHL